MTLGQDNLQTSINLSCTVVNAGSFKWQWQYNGSMLGLSGRSQVLIGDATRTSILTIGQLRYSDAGSYTCQAKHSYGNVNVTRKIELHLAGNLSNIHERHFGVISIVIAIYVYMYTDTILCFYHIYTFKLWTF